MIDGFSGSKAEYSDEQLAELRSLRNAVEELEGEILNARRDVEQIGRLVAEQQRKAEAQAAIIPVVAKFNQACSTLLTSMQELDAIATKHQVRIVKPELQFPTCANFDQNRNTIYIKSK